MTPEATRALTQAGKDVGGKNRREDRAELAEVRAQLRELQQMIGAMNEGAATVSTDGVILDANPPVIR